MRRLPVYVLLDCSGSMSGEPIEAVKNGMQMMIAALMDDPTFSETGWLSFITFGGTVQQIVPLTDITTITPPNNLTAGGGTPLGHALEMLCDCVDNETIKTTSSQKGDYRPMVFILTDGQPTDNLTTGLTRFQQKKWTNPACFLINNNLADSDKAIALDLLKSIASASINNDGAVTGHVFELTSAGRDDIKKLIAYMSTSIKTTSSKMGTCDPQQDPNAIPPLQPNGPIQTIF